MARSQYAKVIFQMERDVFPVNRDVECPFEITESLEADKWDWIGLFSVGWRSQKEYKTYQYVTLPSDYQKGKKAFSKIVFDASTLPKDEEFYQFCYVSRQLSNICGASDPFQFRSSSGKEYVEEECDDMMIIRDKKDVMSDEIQKLSHKLLVLTQERDDLSELTQSMEKSMSAKDEMIGKLNTQVRSLQKNCEKETDRVDELTAEMAAYWGQIRVLREDKKALETQVGELSTKMDLVLDQIDGLKTTIRSLESERDELSGKNRCLVDEVNSYKMEVMESQTTATQNRKTINKLNESLEIAYNQSATAVEECEQLKKQAAEWEDILLQKDQRLAQLQRYKADVDRKREELNNELLNANDKLLACDAMKAKMSSDLEAYEQTQVKMTAKFEHQESELRFMQDRLEQKSKECGDLKKKLAAKDKELEEKTKDLTRTESTLNQTLQEAEAQSTQFKLKSEKLANTERERAETLKQLDIVATQLKNISNEKAALQVQLRDFEEELRQTLKMKDKEVTGGLDELKEKSQMIQARDEEIARKQDEIQHLTEKVRGLQEQLESQNRMLEKEVEELRIAQTTLQDLELRLENCTEKLAQLQLERDAHLEKYKELEATLQEREAKWEDDEAARYCLWKANDALKARVDERDREMNNIMQGMDDLKANLRAERQAKDEKEMEVVDLKHRLELGKLEYQNKVLEHQKLLRRMEKDALQSEASRSDKGSSMDTSLSSSVSDTEAAEEQRWKKYKPKYKALKKERECLLKSLEIKNQRLQEVTKQRDLDKLHAETLADMISELRASLEKKDHRIEELESEINAMKDKTDEDVVVEESEEEESEEEVTQCGLMYGNPYGTREERAAQRYQAELETIIHSTLECAPLAKHRSTANPMSAAVEEGQQLPPPLQPEVLCAQGAAASSDIDDSAAEEGAQEVFEDCSAAIPVNADDSFLDAIGEGMKICPFCQASIMATSDFEEHVATHFGRICPVCRSQADDAMSPQDFEQHVNKCLDRDTASAPPTEEEETDNRE